MRSETLPVTVLYNSGVVLSFVMSHRSKALHLGSPQHSQGSDVGTLDSMSMFRRAVWVTAGLYASLQSVCVCEPALVREGVCRDPS